MARPGIMLYFDILDPIKVLPDAEKGQLLVAMLEYGKYGTVPKFDGMLALAWGFIQPKLDRDEESYENSKVQRRYAAFCKQRSNKGLPKIPFEEWQNMGVDEIERELTKTNEPLRAVNSVEFRYPSTSTSASTKTTTSSTTAAAANTSTYDDAAATAPESNVRSVGGELGKNVVFLSEAQISDLLDKMGLNTFDYYVDKLSTFIIDNGAKVRNHYDTILKWWQEDSAIRR